MSARSLCAIGIIAIATGAFATAASAQFVNDVPDSAPQVFSQEDLPLHSFDQRPDDRGDNEGQAPVADLMRSKIEDMGIDEDMPAAPTEQQAIIDLLSVKGFMSGINGFDQVRPGRAMPDKKFMDKKCVPPFCGVQVDPNLNLRVDYSESAHDEVAALYAQEPGAAMTKIRCSAFAISAGYGLTALHCFGDSGDDLFRLFDFKKSKLAGWALGLPNGRVMFRLKFRDYDNFHDVREIMIPYSMLNLPSHLKRSNPAIDLALFKFEDPILGLSANLKLGDTKISVGQSISFAGYGITDRFSFFYKQNRYASFNVISDVDADLTSEYVKWKSGIAKWAGGPCSGDSGGPVYLGYERGYADDGHVVIGVVSRLETNGASLRTGYGCVGRTGVAVRLERHVPAICSLTANEPSFCSHK
jgi:hypothetical protein